MKLPNNLRKRVFQRSLSVACWLAFVLSSSVFAQTNADSFIEDFTKALASSWPTFSDKERIRKFAGEILELIESSGKQLDENVYKDIVFAAADMSWAKSIQTWQHPLRNRSHELQMLDRIKTYLITPPKKGDLSELRNFLERMKSLCSAELPGNADIVEEVFRRYQAEIDRRSANRLREDPVYSTELAGKVENDFTAKIKTFNFSSNDRDSMISQLGFVLATAFLPFVDDTRPLSYYQDDFHEIEMKMEGNMNEIGKYEWETMEKDRRQWIIERQHEQEVESIFPQEDRDAFEKETFDAALAPEVPDKRVSKTGDQSEVSASQGKSTTPAVPSRITPGPGEPDPENLSPRERDTSSLEIIIVAALVLALLFTLYIIRKKGGLCKRS